MPPSRRCRKTSRGAVAQPEAASVLPGIPAGSAPLTELKIVERITQATDRALDYLESKQSKRGEGAGSWSKNMAINAVAMLALMSKGHVPVAASMGTRLSASRFNRVC